MSADPMCLGSWVDESDKPEETDKISLRKWKHSINWRHMHAVKAFGLA